MKILKENFGKTSGGEQVERYTLENKKGERVSVLSLGLIVQKLEVKNKNDEIKNVVLGFNDVATYEKGQAYYGAIIGRYAGRIADGKFEINGEKYQVPTKGTTALHGGIMGFDKKLFAINSYEKDGEAILECAYTSPDMEEGFPGELHLKVFISFNEESELKFRYVAKSDKDTIVSLTNHSYFNLTGKYAKIYDEELFIDAEEVMVFDDRQAPVGLEPVFKAVDFRKPKRIGDDILDESIAATGGVDHVYKLNKKSDVEVILIDRESGIKIEVETSQKAIVVYCQNFLDVIDTVYDGIKIENHSAVCLETSGFPNAINIKGMESILRAGEVYDELTVYKFSVL